RLGGMDGFEVAQTIRSQQRSRHTPIIFITAYESEDFPPAKAYTLGAVDYLVKPLMPEILRAKTEVFIKLHQRTEQVRERTAVLAHANASLRRANRAMRAISCCNQALIRATDEGDLLREVCRIIVEVAGYRLCWVGYTEHDEAKT